MSTVASNKLETAAEETRELITIFCEMEKRRPFTQDDYSFRDLEEEIFKSLAGQRSIHSTSGSTPATAPSGVSDAGISSFGNLSSFRPGNMASSGVGSMTQSGIANESLPAF